MLHPLDYFRGFRHVREAKKDGQTVNTGARVEAIQKWGGGKAGDSWCCWLVTMVLDMYYCGFLGWDQSPIPRLGSCDDVLQICMDKGWMTDKLLNDGGIYLFFYVRNPDGVTAVAKDAHHIGMASDFQKDSFLGIAGNTTEDGKSSNGDGCYERNMKYTPKTLFAKVSP